MKKKITMLQNNELKKLKPKIIKVLKSRGIKKAGIFGSFVKGQQKENSDIDILIDFKGGLLSFVSIERELEEKIGKKVDLLTYNGLHPLLKKSILSEEVRII